MLKRSERGFSVIELVIVLLVIVLVVGGAFVVVIKQNKDKAYNNASATEQSSHTNSSKPQIQNWPVTIDSYNPSTNLAGDVYMDDTVLINKFADLTEQPVTEFGREHTKKGQDASAINASIDFLTRHGAPVYSVSDGYVLSVEHHQNDGRDDYALRVAPAKTKTTQWMIVYDHVIDPKVKEGDVITAGQHIGTAGPYGNEQPYSFVNLQVNYYPVSSERGSAEAHCPSSLITAGAKQRMTEEFLLLTKAWEEQAASGGVYNEPAWTQLGCVADKVKV